VFNHATELLVESVGDAGSAGQDLVVEFDWLVWLGGIFTTIKSLEGVPELGVAGLVAQRLNVLYPGFSGTDLDMPLNHVVEFWNTWRSWLVRPKRVSLLD